jgi:HD-GYP domain-containing protein (c-di-GMP phosphodiesterase class II)
MDPLETLFGPDHALPARLRTLHEHLLGAVPSVMRVAVALYEPKDDLLKTFINSTREGTALAGYEYRLADSASLSHIAASGVPRVLHDLATALPRTTAHSTWVLGMGYRSSYTVPLYDDGKLLAMLFFDATEPAAFTEAVTHALAPYCGLIALAITTEFAAIRAIAASARVARDFTGLRDFETGAHLDRMARYARLIAKVVGRARGRSDAFIEQVFLFAPLHDVGKIGIPDAILLKPGALTPEERATMQSHVDKGVHVVRQVLGDFGLAQLPDAEMLVNIVRCHHEFLDGSGYPAGLRGDAIPLEARIVTVADIFDALTSGRRYKDAWSLDSALGEMDAMAAAGRLDADCVAALHQVRPQVEAIRAKYPDREQDTTDTGHHGH